MTRNADAMVRSMRAMTLDEWANLDEEEEGELVDGELVAEEAPSVRHEAVVAWLILAVGPWVKQRGGRIFGSELKFRIHERRGRKPDISIDFTRARPVTDARLQRLIPDIFVEVVTAGVRDERRDRVEKMTDYARAGAKWYWLVDPALGSFEIFELTERGTYARVVAATEGAIRDVPGCEGLVLDVDELWAEIAVQDE